MTAFQVVRAVIAVCGVLLFAVGLLVLVVGYPVSGISLLLIGGGGILVVLLERQRYRSQVAERDGERSGPGGGEPTGEALPPEFQPTDERFVDPTTNRVMRVYLDQRTGERRYRAES